MYFQNLLYMRLSWSQGFSKVYATKANFSALNLLPQSENCKLIYENIPVSTEGKLASCSFSIWSIVIIHAAFVQDDISVTPY